MGKKFEKSELEYIYTETSKLNNQSAIKRHLNRGDSGIHNALAYYGGYAQVARLILTGEKTPNEMAIEYYIHQSNKRSESRKRAVRAPAKTAKKDTPAQDSDIIERLERIEKQLTLICNDLGVDVEKKKRLGLFG